MKNWLPLLMAVVGGWLLIAKPDLSKLESLIPSVVNTPATPSQPAPSAEMQAAVAPVTAALKGHPNEAAQLAGYFADFAQVVKAKPELFKTTGALREQQVRAASIYGELNPASVPGIGAAIDAALLAMLGKEDVAVDSAKAQAALNALSWACAGAK